MASLDYIGIGCNRVSQATDCDADGLVAYAASRLVALYYPQDPTSRGVVRTLSGHSDRVNCVRFIKRGSGCGQRDVGLVSGSADRTLRVWKRAGPQKEWRCSAVLSGHVAGVSCLAVARGREISGDTDLIASAASDGTIRMWERRESSSEDDTVSCIQVLSIGARYPLCLALGFLPGLSVPILISGGTDNKLTVFTSKDKQFSKAVVLQGHSDWIRSVEIATFTAESDTTWNQHFRDGDLMVASASQDKYIRLWKIAKSSNDGTTEEPAADDFTAQMKNALAEAGLDDGDAQLSTKAHLMHVEVDSSKHTFSVMFDALLMAHDNWVHSAVWQPAVLDESAKSYTQPMALLSASADKSIMIWKPDHSSETWVNQARLGEIGGSTLGFYGGLFSPDGRYIIANGYNGAINVWAESNRNEWNPQVAICGHTAPVEDLRWDPSGKFIISTSMDQTTRLIAPWKRNHISTWHEIARPQIHGYDLHCVAFFHTYGFVSGADEKVLRVFEAPRTFVQSLEALTREHESAEVVAQRPIGASVPALGLSNKAVFEGDVTQAAAAHDFRNLSAYTAVASTPTSFLDTMTQPPFEQHLLQHTLWPEVNKLYGHGYEIVSVAASHNGNFVASACKAAKAEHASVRLWSTKTWKEVSLPLAAHNLTVTGIVFSPDDRYLLTVGRDRGWAIFHTVNGESYELLSHNPKAHSRIIWGGAWTHDGRMFATGSRDKTVKLWIAGESDPTACNNIATLKLEESVTAVAFAPDFVQDRYVLALGLEDGSILMYTASYDTNLVSFSDPIYVGNAHVATVKALAWRPRPSQSNTDSGSIYMQLASCSEDHSVRLFTVPFPLP
ncbi:WD40-repeat-containing domain protein [Powellomyces hirtus]|nr:WD40-repeat-containing domain protein [Powellomyces hirtus]